MNTTTPDTPTRAGGPQVAVASLDVRGSLVAVAQARRVADRAEADLLGLVVHLVDLHPVGEDTPVAGTVDVLTGEEVPAAGPGTPLVAERAVAELAAALGVSYAAALRLTGDAVELCFRLPRLWALVQAGVLQAWKARQVAAKTTWLSAGAAGFVDRHAAVLGRRNRIPADLAGLVHEALLRCESLSSFLCKGPVGVHR
jgi:hypothetical protein